MNTLAPNTQASQKPSRRQKGFALIATVSIMALLVLIVVGMLALSTSETKKAKQSEHQLIAQANARLALSIALGQLQELAGPDQRVTATASILDSDPTTEAIDGVANPHWVGVWRSDGLKNDALDTGLIQQTTGPVTDRRDITYNKQNETLEWLVSGSQMDPTSNLTGNNVIEIFSADSAAPTTDSVRVEKVKLGETGNYAYWTSDENVKAKANLNKDLNTQVTTTNITSYNKIISPDSVDLDTFYTSAETAEADETDKMVDLNQLALANLGAPLQSGDLKSAVRYYNHDITTSSFSLLTNTRKGGLKKNLTAYINSPAGIPSAGTLPGLQDTDPIIENVVERDTITPKFGAIREWFKLKDLTTGALGSRSINMTYANSTADNAVDITNYTKQPIQPILLDASYQLNYGYDAGTRSVYELIYPRAVIWNPYNVRLTTPKLYLKFEFRANLASYRVRSASPPANFTMGRNHNFGYNAPHHKYFTIPSMTFEPGECLHFVTPSTGLSLSGQAKVYSTTIDNNELSATADPNEQYCFYRQTKTIPTTVRVDTTDTPVNITTLDLNYGGPIIWPSWPDGSGPGQMIYMYANKTGGSPAYNQLGNADFPAIQKFNLDNYARGNNGRWMPNYNPTEPLQPISEILDRGPDSLIGFGARWRHFLENQSNQELASSHNVAWHVAPIAHHNVRSQNIHRWPSDNLFGMLYTSTATSGARSHLYSYGPLSQTREFPQWSDIINSSEQDAETGNNRTAPFFDASTSTTGISTYPLFDIPHSDLIHSIGMLQHVQFSPQVWHPSYIIGNGNASPYLPPHITSLNFVDEQTQWNQKLPTLQTGRNNHIHQRDRANNNPFIFDISYETNLHLWDKYFLSSLPHTPVSNGWNNGKWDDSTPLPNRRMVISRNLPDSDSFANLTDFHKTAKNLMISGGFNINSTSVKAWEATLRSFNGIELQSRTGTSYSANPFSRFLVPETGAHTPIDATDSNLWAGYRDLTNTEIKELAEKIVIQVKKRAPFISVSDFVNRRIGTLDGTNDELQLFGTLQAAINQTQINSSLDLDTTSPLTEFVMPSKEEADNFNIEQTSAWDYQRPLRQQHDTYEYKEPTPTRISKAAGTSGYLTQGDILQQLGSVITARSDSFKIRCYGDSVDNNGKVLAQAWCEATVQRTTTPIHPDPDSAGLDPLVSSTNNLGRKFVITGFRWINQKELSH